MTAHIGNGTPDVTVYEKLTDLHGDSPFLKNGLPNRQHVRFVIALLPAPERQKPPVRFPGLAAEDQSLLAFFAFFSALALALASCAFFACALAASSAVSLVEIAHLASSMRT